MSSRVRARLWLERLSRITVSPGRSPGTSTCWTKASKAAAFTAPSSTAEQRTPERPRAAISVLVFQCPCGTLPIRRSPLGARPRSRVIFGLGPGLVDEDQPTRIQARLIGLPRGAAIRNIRPVLLGRAERLFLKDSPR